MQGLGTTTWELVLVVQVETWGRIHVLTRQLVMIIYCPSVKRNHEAADARNGNTVKYQSNQLKSQTAVKVAVAPD